MNGSTTSNYIISFRSGNTLLLNNFTLQVNDLTLGGNTINASTNLTL